MPSPLAPLTVVALGPEHPDLPGLIEKARSRGVLIAHTHCLPQAQKWLSTLAPDALLGPTSWAPNPPREVRPWDGEPQALNDFVDQLRAPARARALRCGELRAAEGSRRVFMASRPEASVELPDVEWRMFVCLVQHQGRVVTRSELLSEVWAPATAPKPRSVDQVVSRVRRALACLGAREQLRSLRGLGYRLDPVPLAERSSGRSA